MSARPRLEDALLGGAGILGLLLLWELMARIGVVSPAIFPPPSTALGAAFAKMTPAEILGHVGISLQRILLGFLAGGGLGLAIGIASGWYRALDVITRPLIELLRPIPPLAWIPIAIIWLGLDEASKVFIIALAAFFPLVTNAYRGMTAIDPMILRAAQMMDVRGPALLFRVALPAAAPDIATGLRIGWGLSFSILVAAELIAADEGLGFLIMNARHYGEVGIIVFGILLIGTTNLVTDYLLAALIRRRIGRWHPV